MPIAIAAGVVVLLVIVAALTMGRGHEQPVTAPVNAPLDPYAASLPVSNITLSESSNLSGGKVTYVDGHIANKGNRTVTGITVQVIFRDYSNQVAENDSRELQLIRTRQPEVDLESVAAAPLKPGDENDFRLIFDPVSQNWNGNDPEIRVLKVESR
jgi:hypothetical protein